MPKFLPLLAITLLSFFTLELILRVMCTTDSDGASTFRFTRLKPYTIPVKHLDKSIASFTSSDKVGPMYDAELGWALRPNVSNHNGAGFITSAGGIPSKTRSQDTLRIALLGDSYTQGDFEFGWWRVLEQKLNAAGVKAEVLNFGVGGYGMDQAYLRWRRDCALWKPQIVIYGFFADDCTRNLNLFRVLRDSTTGIPLTKPRFILEGDGLKLVNSPTPAPEELKVLSRNLTQWPCLKYEHFYNSEDYRMKPWRWSRLGALLEAKLALQSSKQHSDEYLRVDSESGQIALRVVRRMQEEVKASGANFLVASLSCQKELECLHDSGKLPQEDLLQAMEKEFTVIPTEPPLLEKSKGKDMDSFFGDGHYKAEFNAVVGEKIAGYLLERQRSNKADQK